MINPLHYSWPPTDGYQTVPLLPRLFAAGLLVLWGGATDRAWTIVIGGWLAVPDLDAKSAAMLAGLPLALRKSR